MGVESRYHIGCLLTKYYSLLLFLRRFTAVCMDRYISSETDSRSFLYTLLTVHLNIFILILTNLMH